MKRTAFAALLFVASLLPATAADRIALVIGNSNYSHVPTLANPKNDAREVSTLLRSADYEVTEVLDGTVKEMGVALRTFALAGRKATTAVFYFAGHGFEVAGKNYLAPVDAELAINESLEGDSLDAALGFALDDETLPLESVLGELRKEVPGLKIVVLDCCRDNPFARTRSWARSRSGAGGLAQVTEAQLPEGTMLVFSGEPGQQVPDGTGDHSPFAEALLGEMRSFAGAPVLTVFTGVATKVKGRQKPWIKFDGTGQSLHAFSTVALMSRGVPTEVKAEDSVTSAEMAKLREELATALAKVAAADGNAAEVAKLQKELEEARTKMAEATPKIKTDPAPAPAFPASRGMEGSRTGEMREFGGIEMVWCPQGEFLMGSPASEKERGDETQHRVTLTRGFWLAKTETTQGQWETLMGSNPSYFKGADLPVETVSWDDTQGWLKKMNERHPFPAGWKWELPTEAQWEYACRAGTETPFSFGSVLNGKEANCDGNYPYPYGTSAKGPYLEKTTRVGSYAANAWGLYDMHGNVWELCRDWYGEYPSVSASDSTGSTTGDFRVVRGGSWGSGARGCRSADRSMYAPGFRGGDQGFRPAAVPTGR